jgi:hypothetical protein
MKTESEVLDAFPPNASEAFARFLSLFTDALTNRSKRLTLLDIVIIAVCAGVPGSCLG